MKNFLNNLLPRVAVPLFTLDKHGTIIKLNSLAKSFKDAGNVAVELGQNLINIFLNQQQFAQLLSECNQTNFSFLLNQQFCGTNHKKNNDVYNIVAIKNNEYINVFVCHNEQKLAWKLAEKKQSHELLKRVWQIMFFKKDFDANLAEVFSLIAEYLKVSRVQLFEQTSALSDPSCTHQWIKKVSDHSPALRASMIFNNILPSITRTVKREGLFIATQHSSLTPDVGRFLKLQGIKAIIALPIDIKGIFYGMLTCDDTHKHLQWSTRQIDTILKVGRLISLSFATAHQYLVKHYDVDMLKSIAASLKTSIGIVDKASHEIIFANQQFMETTQLSTMGFSCWNKILIDQDLECEHCILADKDFRGRFAKTLYLQELKAWISILHASMHWVYGTELILFTTEDVSITKLDEQKMRLEASTDPSTKEHNLEAGYKALKKRLEEFIINSDLDEPSPVPVQSDVTIVVLELDHYETIQHALGQKEALIALKKFAAAIKHKLEVYKVYRIGNNQFMVIVDQNENEQSLNKKINELCAYLNKENTSQIALYSVEISFGLANSIKHELQEAEDLMAYALQDLLIFKHNKLKNTEIVLL